MIDILEYYLINIVGKNGWEEYNRKKLDDENLSELEKEYLEGEIQRVSLARTKRKMRELALSNNFEYFGTLTLNGFYCNRYSLDEAQFELRKILKKIKRNNKDFKYLIITEKHKDNAFHFHGLFSRS